MYETTEKKKIVATWRYRGEWLILYQYADGTHGYRGTQCGGYLADLPDPIAHCEKRARAINPRMTRRTLEGFGVAEL